MEHKAEWGSGLWRLKYPYEHKMTSRYKFYLPPQGYKKTLKCTEQPPKLYQTPQLLPTPQPPQTLPKNPAARELA